jgi:hypothetical protein
MGDDIQPGYGSPEDMMGGAGGDQIQQDPGQESQGGDVEAMITEGVQAYMDSGKDPQIAVQICDMLAEAMGLGGQGAPAPDAGEAEPLPGQGVPMARHGGKMGFFNDSFRGEYAKFIGG